MTVISNTTPILSLYKIGKLDRAIMSSMRVIRKVAVIFYLKIRAE